MCVRQPRVSPGIMHFTPSSAEMPDIFWRPTRESFPDWCQPIDMLLANKHVQRLSPADIIRREAFDK